MRRIRSRDTSPEMLVRRFLHSKGLRYRLHPAHLPGKPDLVFPALRSCVFVHGCFWHGCTLCVDGTRRVQSRSTYWIPKIQGNQRRDRAHQRALSSAGWSVHVIWECQLRDQSKLRVLAKCLLSARDRLDR